MKKSIKQNMMYNTIGALVYFFCQWVMSVLVVRLAGYEEAGLWSVAISVTAAPSIVGLFNIRNFQVSDINEEYSLDTYIQSRYFTILMSYLVCIFMIIIGGYNIKSAMVIILYMTFKAIESFVDVYQGIEQKYERLDYAGISMMIRGLGSVIIFSVCLICFQSVLFAIGGMTIFCAMVVLLYDKRIISKLRVEFERKKLKDCKSIKGLLVVCMPLAIVSFLNNLSMNVPKIYLERFWGEEIMGFYSSVASPTAVVYMIATTVFAPLVPKLTEEYNNGRKKIFVNIIMKFFAVALLMSVICLIGSYLLAEWGLTLLFGEDIRQYAYLFVPAIFVSILIAINSCLFGICTLMRAIKEQYFTGIIGVVIAIILSFTVVKAFSMNGVIIALVGSLFIQIFIQIIIIVKRIKKNKETI